MRYVWGLLAAAVLSLPVWAWNGYGPYTGGTVLQLRNELGQLERQVRELQREVDRLRGSGVGTGGTARRYPLPGQTTHGLRPVRDGAYALALNGSTLRFERDGSVILNAAGPLRLEGSVVVSTSRQGQQGDGAEASVTEPAAPPATDPR